AVRRRLVEGVRRDGGPAEAAHLDARDRDRRLAAARASARLGLGCQRRRRSSSRRERRVRDRLGGPLRPHSPGAAAGGGSAAGARGGRRDPDVNVLVVSGIWPPDVGGPASHAPEVADFLRSHGHEVAAIVTADGPPAPRGYPVGWVARSSPKGVLHARAVREIARSARGADVVYATGMIARAAVACASVRRPLVLKLTGDPAFERARRRGVVGGDVASFQRGGGGIESALLRVLRLATLRRAAH